MASIEQIMNEEEIQTALHAMEQDKGLVTKSTYGANEILWPDHKISFMAKHLAYLRAHPNVNPRHYLSNLRLMIKKRP